MNKFELIDAGQNLNKCEGLLASAAEKIDRKNNEGDEAFFALVDASKKIQQTIECLSTELQEVI